MSTFLKLMPLSVDQDEKEFVRSFLVELKKSRDLSKDSAARVSA